MNTNQLKIVCVCIEKLRRNNQPITYYALQKNTSDISNKSIQQTLKFLVYFGFLTQNQKKKGDMVIIEYQVTKEWERIKNFINNILILRLFTYG